MPILRRRLDVAAVPMRLLPPEGLAQEQRTAALAVRVHRAVVAVQLPLDDQSARGRS